MLLLLVRLGLAAPALCETRSSCCIRCRWWLSAEAVRWIREIETTGPLNDLLLPSRTESQDDAPIPELQLRRALLPSSNQPQPTPSSQMPGQLKVTINCCCCGKDPSQDSTARLARLVAGGCCLAAAAGLLAAATAFFPPAFLPACRCCAAGCTFSTSLSDAASAPPSSPLLLLPPSSLLAAPSSSSLLLLPPAALRPFLVVFCFFCLGASPSAAAAAAPLDVPGCCFFAPLDTPLAAAPLGLLAA